MSASSYHEQKWISLTICALLLAVRCCLALLFIYIQDLFPDWTFVSWSCDELLFLFATLTWSFSPDNLVQLAPDSCKVQRSISSMSFQDPWIIITAFPSAARHKLPLRKYPWTHFQYSMKVPPDSFFVSSFSLPLSCFLYYCKKEKTDITVIKKICNIRQWCSDNFYWQSQKSLNTPQVC